MSGAPMPPYGVLIEEAREKARLSRREAARRAGISGNWWRYVVDGYQGETPVRGSAETVAAMARVVGLPPERLESDGQRPDAAEALRSQPDPQPPRLSAVPDRPSLPPDPTDKELHYFIAAQEPYELRKLLLDTLYFEAVKYPERIKGIRALTDPVDLGEGQAERRREPGA